MNSNTSQQHSVDAQVQKHVDELLKLGWQFRGRGLYPTWGRGECIHACFRPKPNPPLND
jgi:hypothetical protein